MTTVTDIESWERELLDHRERKDEYFGEHPRSPLPPAAREVFDGLEYYPPDPDLRFELPLEEVEETETLTVATTTDGEREYLRWGEFHLQIDDAEVTLTAYKAEEDEPRLWVPFRDETNGEATYGGGRYLDLEDPDDRVDGDWVLDFNRAYNPTCVYSDRYECPMVPMENWLDVPVEAGEKLPDLPTEEAHGHAHDH